MASTALRPALRQALAASTLSRTFTTAALPAFRSQSLLARQSPLALQRAAFQTSSKRAILPPLPQVMEGTVNDAARVPDPEPSHGSYHWTMERMVGLSLVPLTIAPFAAGSLNPVLDGAFISLLIIHSYVGFQSCITDYFPKWRVPRWRKFFDWANFVMVGIVGWGWYEFETNDVGLTEGIRRVWKAGSKVDVTA
ncbi:hypothetical protein LTR85_005602 [Meristemomyces frigidus]|nr:hypothetical protein LTR85_005602 [Meristemomyces frigidus]